ncbi:DUF3021 domain-containing protein [Geomicrobium sp. JCM 19039]|uniref:DUF3021 domain-containing protein n=1 Tax=Geomicrobium sp. JCM 19039 TaxID=1460636 RepID=UPI00045F316E|nr:DUF3021 domain-containing protein [Geomicrobium sp. JCM 19039]GAK11587.1 hypothetical protein JCM19039_1292 [Geomicrobium sp. JCM 19039]
MAKEIIYRLFAGIGAGGIVTFVFLTYLMIIDLNPPVAEIWRNMLGGMLVGVYFSLSSFVFDFEKWSTLKATIVHYATSIIVYFSIALIVSWVPLRPLPLLLAVALFTLFYALHWTGFYLYYRRLAKNFNESLNRDAL